MHTPTTPEGLRQYDRLSPAEAALSAWREFGPRPDWHRRARQVVDREEPVLAAALALGDLERITATLYQPVPAAVREAMPLLARAADRAWLSAFGSAISED